MALYPLRSIGRTHLACRRGHQNPRFSLTPSLTGQDPRVRPLVVFDITAF